MPVCGYLQLSIKASLTLPFWSVLRFLVNSSALVLLETVILFTAFWAVGNTLLGLMIDLLFEDRMQQKLGEYHLIVLKKISFLQ